ncbi:MAG: hypothetical protein QM541_14780 [Flavobacterium sp.]|nr:hypothetical protein [Flavobacterium sp.]
MTLNLIEKNIVILGIFKPNLFDKLFFIKNNLADESHFTDKSVFIPELSIIDTNEFIVNITQNRIVINTKNANINNNIQNIAASIIINTDSIINAIGYNLKWVLFIEQNLNKFSKQLFFSDNNKTINNYFNSEDTEYGYYVSKDYEYSRLKLDIKPSIIQKIDTNEKIRVLTFDFNFHIENNHTAEELKKIALDYENFISIANKIVAEYD